MSIFQELSAPFPPDAIHWRIGSTNQDKTRGLALAYLDARDVMGRLDAAVGPENWQDRYEMHGARTLCFLSIRIDGEWITKSDGAGDTDVEAEKGSISDAFKRAAVKWGIGRYLYNIDAPWVAIEGAGRSYKIKDGEKRRLAGMLSGIAQQSSAAAKRNGSWDELQANLNSCGTVVAVDRLRADYERNTYPQWNQDWRDAADEAFAKRIAEIEDGVISDPVPHPNGAQKAVPSSMQAQGRDGKLSGSDAEKLRDTMLAVIKASTDAAALEKWAVETETRKNLKKLPRDYGIAVSDAFDAKLNELSPVEFVP